VRHISLKRRYTFNRLHGVMHDKHSNVIVPVVRTSDLTDINLKTRNDIFDRAKILKWKLEQIFKVFKMSAGLNWFRKR